MRTGSRRPHPGGRRRTSFMASHGSEDGAMDEASLFAAALERPTLAQRRAFLDEACGGDVRLRERVERLLAADGHAEGFLSRGPDATADEAPLGERPGTLIGPYKLLQQIGEGGMGTVFLAEQQEP